MKRVLVVGGSSFVARNIVSNLSTSYVFTSLTRTPTGYENEVLVADYFTIEPSIFQDVDIVINCTAIVHQPKITDEASYNRVNFELAIHLATLAKEAGVQQFLQLSTIAVYGSVDQLSIETKELPTNPYGRSKLKADEALLRMASDTFIVICIRPPMIYGGGNAPGNMMRLITLVDKKIPLPFGNAHSKRDFIYIHTLVRYCQYALELNKSACYVVRDSFSVTTKDLVQIISKSLGFRTHLFSIPSFLLTLLNKVKPGIVEKLFGQLIVTPNLEQAGFSSPEDLEKGIAEMVTFYQNQGN